VIAAHPTSSRSRPSKAEASVTEKDLVELRSVRLGAASRSIAQDAVGNIKRKELREPFWVVRSAGSRATDGARGTLARMSQEVRAIHLLRRVLCDRCAARVVGVAKDQAKAGAMRSNVARRQPETKPASSPAARPYRIEEQVGYLLRRAHQRASSIFQVSIGDPNITPTQYSSMVKLHEYTELSQNHLGRLVGMDKATMQGVVRRLKERHLVDSRPHPGDARRTLLSLTTEGHRLITKLLVNGPAVSRETLKPLSNQEQRQLLELLSRII
jgi:DNA-binding MarR family transcriptional regulator